MSKTAVIGIVVLLAAAWFAYDYVTSPVEEVWAPSASFMCKNGTNFVVGFPNEERADVYVAGDLSYSLTRTDGGGQRYENAAYLYVFAGEGVTVTEKASDRSTTCTQPVDENNAPMNFGDMGEGGGETQDMSAAAGMNMVGTWQSTDDAEFTRQFSADGTVVDAYEGSASTEGTWKIYTNETSAVDLSIPLEEGVAYLEIQFEGEVYHYKIVRVTPDALELIYLDRGGVLLFTKVQ